MPDQTPKMTGLSNVLEMLKVMDDIPASPQSNTFKVENTKGFPDHLKGDEVLCSYTISIENRRAKDGRIYAVTAIKGTVPALPQLVVVDLMQVIEALLVKKEF